MKEKVWGKKVWKCIVGKNELMRLTKCNGAQCNPGKKETLIAFINPSHVQLQKNILSALWGENLRWWFWSSWFRNSDLHINVLWSCAFVQLVQAVTLKWKFYATSPVNTNSSVGENGFLVKNGPCVPWWNASICTVSYRAPANYRIVHLVILANLNWGLARFIWNLLFIWSYEIKIYMKK